MNKKKHKIPDKESRELWYAAMDAQCWNDRICLLQRLSLRIAALEGRNPKNRKGKQSC